MPKNVQIAVQSHSIYILARLYRRSFKLVFSSTWIENFHIYRLGFEEAEEPEIKFQHSLDHGESKGIPENTSASLTTLKPLTVWITTNCGKFLKRWEYQTTLPVSWETYMGVKKQQLGPDMEQLTGSKFRKGYVNAIYCHPVYLTDMQSTYVKCWAGWITSWDQDCWEKYQKLQICRWYYSNGRKQRASWWVWKWRMKKLV